MIGKCSYCGIREHMELLDGVLKNEKDTGRLACIKCYPGGGWAPCGNSSFALSVAPSLATAYALYRERQP